MSTESSPFAPNARFVRIANDILVNLGNRFLFPQGIAGDFLNHGSSVNRLQSEAMSVIRWGDGESLILLGGDIYFQPFSLQLRSRLLEIIINFKKNCGYHLAIPTQYLDASSTDLKNSIRGKTNDFDIWKGSRYVHWRYFPKNIQYLDAFLFKGAMAEQLNEVRKIFSMFSSFVVVSSETDTIDTFFERNLKSANYRKVAIPANDAFSLYDDILYEVETTIADFSGMDQKNILILLSAGPCAKVLAYDLTKRGHTAFDIGKLFRCWI